MKYRDIVYTVQSTIKAQIDDADITPALILSYVRIAESFVAGQLVGKGGGKEADFLYVFEEVPVEEFDSGRKYIRVPLALLSNGEKEGIEFVSYSKSFMDKCQEPLAASFNRTDLARKSIFGDAFRKPSPTNPYFSRAKFTIDAETVDVLVLLGLDCLAVDKLDIGILTAVNPNVVCDLDHTCMLPDNYLKLVVYEALNIAKFALGIKIDLTNDGSDKTRSSASEPLPTNQAQAPN